MINQKQKDSKIFSYTISLRKKSRYVKIILKYIHRISKNANRVIAPSAYLQLNEYIEQE